MRPSISCIVGDFGSGKTLFMTYLAYMNQNYRKIFANYHLNDIPYTYISINDLAKFPDELRNAIVLIDEGHVGANAYDVFKKDVRNIAQFITQIRKRNIVMFWSTQRFRRVALPLRELTKYFYEMHPTEYDGVSYVKIFDIDNNYEFIKEFIFDGRKMFGKYDTEEIILNKTE